MTADQALELALGLLQVTVFIAAPVLVAALLAGVTTGILQAATQINEASISFIAKASAIIMVSLTLGPTLASHAVTYARNSITAIEHVVK